MSQPYARLHEAHLLLTLRIGLKLGVKPPFTADSEAALKGT